MSGVKRVTFETRKDEDVVEMVRDVVDENRELKLQLAEMTRVTLDLDEMLRLDELDRNERLREALDSIKIEQQKILLANHVRALQGENQNLRHVVRHREATIDNFVQLLTEHREKAKETSHQLKGENENLKDKVTALEIAKNNLQNEINQIPELMSELESLRLKIHELMKKNESLTEDLERARSDLRMVKLQRQQLEHEESLSSSLSIQRINDLIRENANLYYQLGFARSELNLRDRNAKNELDEHK